jgi:hypothetical protein
MRSDSLLFTLVLLLVWESVIPAQGRGAPESGGSSALAPDAAHLKFKPAEWRSLNERQIVTRPLAGGHSKEIAGFGAMIADAASAHSPPSKTWPDWRSAIRTFTR